MSTEKEDMLLPDSYIEVPKSIGKYNVMHTISKGKSSVVVYAVDKKTNENVAIKIFVRNEITKQNMMSYFENELRLSSRFNHPNIVRVLEIIYEEEYIMIVMEYLPNGDLTSLLHRSTKLSIEEMMKITYEILLGLDYLHKRGISHRNLSPDNVLFDKFNTPKLIDFGLSKENSSIVHTMCGTPRYIAPEVILSRNYDGRKADIWSFGVLLHLLVCGTLPWSNSSEAQYVKAIQDSKLQINIEPKGIMGSLITKSLVIDPLLRASSEELLSCLDMKNHKKIIMARFVSERRTSSGSILPKLNLSNGIPCFSRSRLIHDKVIGKLPQNIKQPKNLRDV
ncbi:CAMK family protein kinase [Trichomonas vaginalis G3]|uniref:CAMK family protein kinase n=1 Tax=Trichomonas vaginalis (strain ATCC PRA-98 / G3) TaxID=412133 RepID=A2EWX3_TRIV3|nr:protein serine/threonine kinase protein [Trichomonas vaginalis G3]EAY02815.1 CAMK family protein kinase [Trichomonas vaginalis G3]KAI5525649.1 protein serine/threonine kinase protein [Trichomonas vaginalis G3]|eukprot:XP_001315038.1 CAMK family protein kinase [Trichomonas vaginalis G3]